jgi:predicted nucleic acid-binding protein
MVAHVDGGFVDFGRAELPFNYGNKGLTGADKALIVLTMLQRKVWLGLAGVAEAESEEQQLAQADKAQNELEAVLNAINDAESLDALRAIVNRHGKGPNAAAIIAAASARKLAIKPAKTTNGDDQ